MKAMKWIAKNSGKIIKRTAISAASIIGLAILSTMAEGNGYDEFEGYGDEEMDVTDDETIEVEGEVTAETEEETKG